MYVCNKCGNRFVMPEIKQEAYPSRLKTVCPECKTGDILQYRTKTTDKYRIAIKTPQRGADMSALMTETLPFVFYGTSIISGHVSNSMWFGNTWVSSGTNTLNYTISRATAADSDSCDIRMFIIGKWK